MTHPESFILIPGRTSRQGTTLNEGKFTAGYVEETGVMPIPLRPAFESLYPSDEAVLRRIEKCIRELQGVRV
jgi:hypothetical protein